MVHVVHGLGPSYLHGRRGGDDAHILRCERRRVDRLVERHVDVIERVRGRARRGADDLEGSAAVGVVGLPGEEVGAGRTWPSPVKSPLLQVAVP